MRPADPMQRRENERRARTARRTLAFTCPKPPLGELHQNDLKKAKTLTAATPQGSQPITPEPAPSHRLWASAWARPLADANYTNTHSQRATTKGTFLLCWERGTFSGSSALLVNKGQLVII